MKSQYPVIQHINFSRLHEFTGGNIEFSKNLIVAFLTEMETFMSKISPTPTEEDFVSFRKSYHSISPSLQMLGMSDIINIIESYKAAYLNQTETFSEISKTLTRWVQESINEANQWLTVYDR